MTSAKIRCQSWLHAVPRFEPRTWSKYPSTYSEVWIRTIWLKWNHQWQEFIMKFIWSNSSNPISNEITFCFHLLFYVLNWEEKLSGRKNDISVRVNIKTLPIKDEVKFPVSVLRCRLSGWVRAEDLETQVQISFEARFFLFFSLIHKWSLKWWA